MLIKVLQVEDFFEDFLERVIGLEPTTFTLATWRRALGAIFHSYRNSLANTLKAAKLQAFLSFLSLNFSYLSFKEIYQNYDLIREFAVNGTATDRRLLINPKQSTMRCEC